ncbi:hypothetical protein ACOMHN_023552 [Nucella lapillus]
MANSTIEKPLRPVGTSRSWSSSYYEETQTSFSVQLNLKGNLEPPSRLCSISVVCLVQQHQAVPMAADKQNPNI